MVTIACVFYPKPSKLYRYHPWLPDRVILDEPPLVLDIDIQVKSTFQVKSSSPSGLHVTPNTPNTRRIETG
jgi:hypothetical protein